MKNLKEIIIERLHITKDTGKTTYTCYPKDWDELRSILEERLAKDKNADLNDIDVSQITFMYNEEKDKGLFEGLDPHNIKIDKWDVSNVENMCEMFYNCHNFNCNLGDWNVENVKYMRSMFFECINFDCDLCNWNVHKVEDMKYMFYGCYKFDCNLDQWDISNVTRMHNMFYFCTSLTNKPSWYKK